MKKAKRWSGHTSNVCFRMRHDETWNELCHFLFKLLRIREILRIQFLLENQVEHSHHNPSMLLEWGINLERVACRFVDSLIDGSYMFIRAVEVENYFPRPAGHGHVAQRGEPCGGRKHVFLAILRGD